ncbi:hypothetical protein EAH75_01250 [Rhodanobacter glycinis]|uniref:hypothetical protein n=1 Tax=Rhodanobacter glycinis TaxID=582702 RepID=UPI001125E0FB|nr:hypothetical protein [Rhodanobacter glycinis]TPG50153.1 hypothetical protein EAH75_01250 [Rhodanobacter glycinis]
MSDIQFINGLNFKAPNEKAPEYVKAKGSIKRADLISTLQGMDGDWVNFDVKVSQNGKWYCAVDTWRPNSEGQSDRPAQRQESKAAPVDNGFDDDSIPFK